MAREVPQALQVAHRHFWGAVVTALVGIYLCVPRWSDASHMAELQPLQSLVEELDPATVERELLQKARTLAMSSLAGVAADTEGRGVRDLEASSAQAALFQVRPLRLSSLGALHEAGQRGAELVADGPDMALLARGLRWRLGRTGGPRGRVLTGLELDGRTASAAQLASEAQVETRRLAYIRTRSSYQKHRHRFTRIRKRAEGLRSGKASRRARRRIQDKRHEAYLAMEAAKLESEAAHAHYDQAVDEAQGPPRGQDPKQPGIVVVATFTHADGAGEEVIVPVPRVTRRITTPPAKLPAALAQLASGPGWPQLEQQTLAQAAADASSQLSWHGREWSWGKGSVRGASLLLLLPLCWLAQLAWLSRCCHAVREAFSPFRHPGAELPRVGTGIGRLDAALLVGLPSVVVGLACVTLYRLDAHAWLAPVLGLPCLAYAAHVLGQWQALSELRTSIIRSCRPPPLEAHTGHEAV